MTLKRFVIGGIVVTLPLLAIQVISPRYAYFYVWLILFSMTIFYSDKISSFAGEIRSAI